MSSEAVPASVLPLDETEWQDLRRARALLERPKLALRLGRLIGQPLEQAVARLPVEWSEKLNRAGQRALLSALNVALTTLEERRDTPPQNHLHRLMVGATGAVGGAFGLLALSVELPLSTTLMLRSIADIARAQGLDTSDPEVKLGCLEVFALGGPQRSDDAGESIYWATRAALAGAVTQAAAHIARHGVAEGGPALVQLITRVGARFGLMVSQQAAAKAIPLLGAIAGGAINLAFMRHFQDMATGHFIVKRLEARHGSDLIRTLYAQAA